VKNCGQLFTSNTLEGFFYFSYLTSDILQGQGGQVARFFHPYSPGSTSARGNQQKNKKSP